jgi:hypothetical protein
MRPYKLFHSQIENFTPSDALMKAINLRLQLPQVRNRERGKEWDSHEGYGETTEPFPDLGPMSLIYAADINKFVIDQASAALNRPCLVTRSWINRMELGSQGRCHNHVGKNTPGLEKTPDLVAIFYLNNSYDGSKLIIVSDGVSGELPSEMSENRKTYITPSTGSLIMHDADVWHAVSEHRSTVPRICFVYHLEVFTPSLN